MNAQWIERSLSGLLLASWLVTASTASAQTTLTMWSFLDPAKDTPRERVLRGLIGEYEKKHPGVKIRVEPQVWSQIANKFTIAASSGRAPDIAWVNYPSLVLPLSAGIAADLKATAFGKWDQKEWDDYVTTAPFDAVTQGGKILAAPIMLLSNTLIYRKDLFEASGVTPTDVGTWDGLLASAKKMTKSTGGNTTWGLGIPLSRDGASQPLLAVAMAELQPKLFDAKCVPDVSTEAGIKALSMAANLVKEGAVSKESLVQTSDDSQELFIGGRQAITVAGTSRVASIQQKAVFDKSQVGVLPWPSWTQGKTGPYILDGWTAVVWKGSPNVAQAADFVSYMVGAEASAKWTVEGGQVPFRKSVLKLPALASPELAWMKAVAEGWGTNATFLPPQCNVGAFYGDLNLAVQKVVRGDATAAAALAEVVEEGRNRAQ
ncbi:ABC transporter substrate-binding protein [Chelatococcus asaccharovorans]|uniref:ABC transporter substrate-binding protein n=1 Tax=Chelatococcus asaccharovorans TaxID=28210 RepID=UPI00224C7788|nr:extracellular solute-binding protein [Chelatococcus asaccharovorans]CAH1660078.1 Carbohydrate ABC transporter substrate-binding protein (CUT1 family) [Chelatococcus asaccharovorans]CAH1683945.1 Carbohydrate ABC transporter substrate-binding protein (CUT1 family) [Chelatococcus asaccharovorans]